MPTTMISSLKPLKHHSQLTLNFISDLRMVRKKALITSEMSKRKGTRGDVYSLKTVRDSRVWGQGIRRSSRLRRFEKVNDESEDSGSSWEEVSGRDHLSGVGVTEVDDRQEKTEEWT
ncbi:hypothetical protein HAX54_028628 [Datura stramonium]|uniref:Uncharacterized protein n=1 Tax=Datura stramonium TaxID=4076 RepID=A0ABS8V7B6_DATST|nr:hypothetical protein [Datura stramonium]